MVYTNGSFAILTEDVHDIHIHWSFRDMAGILYTRGVETDTVAYTITSIEDDEFVSEEYYTVTAAEVTKEVHIDT